MRSLKVSGSLLIENNQKQVMEPGRNVLLVAKQRTSSIISAESDVRISFQRAWGKNERAMNPIYLQPVTECITAGANGGGTRHSAEAAILIATYEMPVVEKQEFTSTLSEAI